jgi:hypothetical protein
LLGLKNGEAVFQCKNCAHSLIIEGDESGIAPGFCQSCYEYNVAAGKTEGHSFSTIVMEVVATAPRKSATLKCLDCPHSKHSHLYSILLKLTHVRHPTVRRHHRPQFLPLPPCAQSLGNHHVPRCYQPCTSPRHEALPPQASRRNRSRSTILASAPMGCPTWPTSSRSSRSSRCCSSCRPNRPRQYLRASDKEQTHFVHELDE